MKKEVLTECIIAVLVLLFVYAGSSKLMDMKGFRAGMMIQPFPAWMSKLLAAALPFAEVLIAAGLIFEKTRKAGLYAYAFFMCCFSSYTALVVFDFFKHAPCGCGGIISGLSWTWHFIINLIFLALAWLAIRLNNRTTLLRNQGVSQKPVKE